MPPSPASAGSPGSATDHTGSSWVRRLGSKQTSMSKTWVKRGKDEKEAREMQQLRVEGTSVM